MCQLPAKGHRVGEPMTERVAIVGARNASPETLAKVRALVASLPKDATVISGGAIGVDREAVAEAHRIGRGVEEFIPDYARWAVVGVGIWGDGDVLNLSRLESARDLLLSRNTMIAVRCTRMVAFVQGSRGGTFDAIEQAKRFRRSVEVIK